MPNQLSSGRAFSARVLAMTDEIERLEIAVVSCMEHAESLRQRITRLEASVAEAASPCAAAGSNAGGAPAENHDRPWQPASALAPAPAARPLAAVRVPIRLRQPRDPGRIVNATLYAASAVLVGTLLSLASW